MCCYLRRWFDVDDLCLLSPVVVECRCRWWWVLDDGGGVPMSEGGGGLWGDRWVWLNLVGLSLWV
ncbi:hypothetical protein Hanom_Chr04g00298761 [Helianthus anomalus]